MTFPLWLGLICTVLFVAIAAAAIRSSRRPPPPRRRVRHDLTDDRSVVIDGVTYPSSTVARVCRDPEPEVSDGWS